MPPPGGAEEEPLLSPRQPHEQKAALFVRLIFFLSEAVRNQPFLAPNDENHAELQPL